jgi:hypothetical protein
MNIEQLFKNWQKCQIEKPFWGLTWFLASQICKRFYASHGIVPWVINKEGMGYYGILFSELPCSVNKHPRQLGRLTMAGNTENWLSVGSEIQGRKGEIDCENGASISTLITESINHLSFPAMPHSSHLSCRHKRWGDSYTLCFEIATCIALRFGHEQIGIWNSPSDIRHCISKYDPKMQIKEHPGGFLFLTNEAEVFLVGDGRLLHPAESNMWEMYMLGQTPYELSNVIINHLGLPIY